MNNINSKTKPAADDGGKNDSDDEEVALTAAAVADSPLSTLIINVAKRLANRRT